MTAVTLRVRSAAEPSRASHQASRRWRAPAHGCVPLDQCAGQGPIPTHPNEVQISTDCWRASNEGDEQDKAAWLKAKRAEEQTASEAWSEQYRMPPREGTERAVPWGVRCRHQIVTNAYTALVTEGTSSEAEWAEIEENARTVTRAGWWIDQRSSEPEDLTELLRAATEADRPTENPFF